MVKNRQVEVLAPAGSYESMEAAFAAGADAAYIGGSRFGARAYAENLDREMLCRAIDYAHLHGRRLYMTVNTLFKEQELKELPDYLLAYYKRGLDAVIVQDLGAMAVIRRYFPDLPVHASTQMTITGVYGAKLLKELGASRIVTARELSLEEIRQIHQQVDVEIEGFVHGALCYCYSGQCLMSSLIGGRSGNRGRCAQPCRLPYEVWQGGKKVNKSQEGFVLSLKDLCTLDLLPDILEAGVYSLKIEGRMKSSRYTAGVTAVYRKYVDQYLANGRKGYQVDPKDKQMLLDLFDRGGFTEGYSMQHNGKSMLALKEKPAFRETNQKLMEEIDQTWVKKKLQEPICGCLELTPNEEAKLTLMMTGAWKKRNPEEMIQAVVYGQEVQPAKNQPMTRETISRQIKKTGNTPFVFEEVTIVLNGDVFLPLQALNELRRKGLEELEKQILSADFGRAKVEIRSEKQELGNTDKDGLREEYLETKKRRDFETKKRRENKAPCLVVSVEEQHQLGPVLSCDEVGEVYLDADGFPAQVWEETVFACRQTGKRCFLLMPEIFRTKAVQYFQQNKEQLKKAGFDGLVVRNLEEVQWWRENAKILPLLMDTSLYTWNRQAIQVMEEMGASRIAVPSELNVHELRERGTDGQELLVYGRLPMMVSAQCVQKTILGCSRRRGEIYLKDRTGKEMPVKNRCRFCYNTIYNASPLSLLGQENLVETLNPAYLRLHFTNETQGEAERVLKAWLDGFYYHRAVKSPLSDFTRGHFKRGVE